MSKGYNRLWCRNRNNDYDTPKLAHHIDIERGSVETGCYPENLVLLVVILAVNWRSIMSLLTVFIPPLAFIVGIVVQCASLLRKKPPRASYILFVLMLMYMGGMMIFAMNRGSANTEARSVAEYIPVVMTFGMVISFLFIAVFLKETVHLINETVIISNTVSYVFLVAESWSALGGTALTFAIIAGLVMGTIAVRLIMSKAPISDMQKYLLYGWYLLVNGFFAVSYFSGLGLDFHMLSALVNEGKVSVITLFILGMIEVHVIFNFGILYYCIMFSIISSDTRKGLMAYTSTIFHDSQADIRSIKALLVTQAGIFLLAVLLFSIVSYHIMALWILLTPLIIKVFSRLRKG